MCQLDLHDSGLHLGSTKQAWAQPDDDDDDDGMGWDGMVYLEIEVPAAERMKPPMNGSRYDEGKRSSGMGC